MLVTFGPPGICLHDGGSIYLVSPDKFYRYFRSGGIDLLVPPDRLRGDRIPRDTGARLYATSSSCSIMAPQKARIVDKLNNQEGC